MTSANAVKIVKELPNKNIFFIPDRNLAHFVADHVPEKNFVYNNGFCPTHERMEPEDVGDIRGHRSSHTENAVQNFLRWQITWEAHQESSSM